MAYGVWRILLCIPFATILALPTYVLRLEVFDIRTNVLDILLLVSVIAMSVSVFASGAKQSRNPDGSRRRRPLTGLLLATTSWFILLLLIGVLTSALADSTLSFRELGMLKSYFILPIAFAFLFAITHTDFRKQFLALKCFAASALLAAAISWGFAAFAEGITFDGRLRGFWESPNQLAMYIAPALLLFWISARNHQYAFSRNLDILSLSLLGITLLFTQSIGGIITTLLSIMTIEMPCRKPPPPLPHLFPRKRCGIGTSPEGGGGSETLPFSTLFPLWGKHPPRRGPLGRGQKGDWGGGFLQGIIEIIILRRILSSSSLRAILRAKPWSHVCSRRIRMFLQTFAVLLIASFAIAMLSHEKLASWASLDERSSIASRMMIWQAAWDIGKDHPLLGIGPGNFQAYYLDYQQYYPPYLEWAVPHPHNIFLAFWLSSGLLGLLGFLGITGWTLWRIVKKINHTMVWSKVWSKHKSKQDILLLFTLHYVLFSVLLWGLIDTPYWRNDLAVVFWLFVAIAITNADRTCNRIR